MRQFTDQILLLIILLIFLFPFSVLSSPIDHLQNNHSLLNSFLTDKDGKLYLIYNNSFFYKCNERGDAWCRITDNIRSVAIDPDDSKIIYIIRTNNSVEKTVDGGNNWIKINSGLSRNISLNCIFINPHNKEEVFLGSNIGLFKTTDAGFLWQPTSLNEHISQFFISPTDKSIFFVLTPSGFYSSKDAGITWNRIDDTLPKMTIKKMGRTAEKIPIKVVGIAFVNHLKPVLLAFTAETNIKDRIIYKIFKSENNGLSWIDVSNGFNDNEPPSSIYINNFNIFIGCEGRIYESKDAISWKTIEIENEGKITGIYQLQDNQGFIINDLNGRLIFVDKDSKFIGLNYGVLTHSQILAINHTVINGQRRIYALVRNNNYIDIDRYGLFYSTDDGKSWRKSLTYENSESFRQRIYISPHNNNEMWLFDGYRLFYTTDLINNKWEQSKITAYYDFDFDPIDRNIKYACIHEDMSSILYKYKYNEESKQGGWTKLKNEVRRILISKDDNKKLLTDKLDLSLDGGWTWKNISSKEISEDCIRYPCNFTYYPFYFNSTNILLFVHAGTCAGFQENICLALSNDLGDTWQLLKTFNNLYVLNFKDELDSCFYINPQNDKDIFLSYQKREQEQEILFIDQSIDGGNTWKPFAIYTPDKTIAKFNIRHKISIAIIKEDVGSAIYLGTATGLYKTIDNGLTWELLGGIRKEGNIEMIDKRIKSPS